MIKKVIKWAGNFLFVVLLIVTIFSFYGYIQHKKNPSKLPSVLGIKVMSVLTGSMRPTLEPGDLILSKDVSPDEIKVGDVVTYRVNSHTLVTHRVIDIINKDGKLAFQTKGDANNVEDGGLVLAEELVGSLALNIPKGGYIVDFIRRPIGLVLLIILPIFFLLGGEIKNMLSRMDDNGKKKSNHKDNMKI
ncbi:MAG: signal peptidase I [Tissierellales bacterium]